MNSAKRILFSANDPGGANAILPVVQALCQKGFPCQGMLTGPAQRILNQVEAPLKNAEGITEAELTAFIDAWKPDLLLAGRSAADDAIDKRILVQLKKRRIPAVYVLDFWNEYWQRFSSPGQKDFKYLPTAICVMDQSAKDAMIAEGVSAERIYITGNPHFEHFAEGITRGQEDQNEILFISQPIGEPFGLAGQGPDEFRALADSIEILKILPSVQLRIRLHPKEDAHKYDVYLSGRVRVSGTSSLEEALSHAGLIVGLFSPVLMQAALAGKPVISYQPGGSAEDPLPTNAIGITRLARTPDELRALIQQYQGGTFPRATNIKNLWPAGATERVVAVIDGITPR